jgi:N-acetyl-anhydromuramyl-L-alanine amidase AmpD
MSTFPPDSFIVSDVVPSPNLDDRKDGRPPDMILLHYTGMQSGEAALARLTMAASKVSSHYVVFEDGRITQCVPEDKRAWHAGESSWAGETDINSLSIGIEIVNPGHEFGYRNFPLRQTAAVISLCKSIITRRGPIGAERILGHSDVAPSRKQDPGEKFPWELLSESGIGHWVRAAPAILWLWHRGNRQLRRRHPRRGRRFPAPFPPCPCRWDRRSVHTAHAAGADRNAAGTAAAKRLTPLPPPAIPMRVSRPDGRPAPMPKGGRGGKSGLHGRTVPDNVRRGSPHASGNGPQG